ncbi:beta-phosphoglucomutase [Paenibacillus sp. N1-5-1-14]|uniref:beta-phosphoglucomutase n=1 Tax=Paenibacillus radicibacter TaxID=2972488 RepID=UPI0021598500|nr:beta-phosphoglucomutase [Paenibacillus radicibacter]MCR8644590.1 beta-phosphoglucomutase [Paenibacillus radicibacter]
MNNFNAVIFDLDGVLVSTDDYHYKAWKQIADRLEIPFDETVNHQLRGVSRMESLHIILSHAEGRTFSEETRVELAEEKNRLYRQTLNQLSPTDILPGVIETLDGLEARGIAIAVGSSSKNAPFILDKIGLSERFAVIVDGNHITKSKPDPEVFLLAATKLECATANCLVVEDAIAGVVAGLRADMQVAAVGDASKSALATYRLGSIEELLKFV